MIATKPLRLLAFSVYIILAICAGCRTSKHHLYSELIEGSWGFDSLIYQDQDCYHCLPSGTLYISRDSISELPEIDILCPELGSFSINSNYSLKLDENPGGNDSIEIKDRNEKFSGMHQLRFCRPREFVARMIISSDDLYLSAIKLSPIAPSWNEILPPCDSVIAR